MPRERTKLKKLFYSNQSGCEKYSLAQKSTHARASVSISMSMYEFDECTVCSRCQNVFHKRYDLPDLGENTHLSNLHAQ